MSNKTAAWMIGGMIAWGLAWSSLAGSAHGQCTSSSFGYPTAGATCGRGGQIRQNWQQSHAEARAQAEKVFLRNEAWPKPFACWDRQSYFAVWHPMYDAGLASELTLQDAHFEHQTDKLNNFGLRRLAAIIGNQSQQHPTVWVAPSADDKLTQSRVEYVRFMVDRLLNTTAGATVAVSDQSLVPITGRYHSTVNQLRTQQTPAPVISIGNQGSLAGSVQGN